MTHFNRPSVILIGSGVDFIPLVKYLAAENENLKMICVEIK